MNLIVCVDENWGIGYEGNLLYHFKEDMRFFRNKTLYNIVIMGKNTFLSLPKQKALEDRHNIVLTTDENFKAEDVSVCHSLTDCYELLKYVFENSELTSENVFIIGGGSVYKQFLPYCEKAYVTMVKEKSDNCDTYFENLDKNINWRCTRFQFIPDTPLCIYEYKNQEVKEWKI